MEILHVSSSYDEILHLESQRTENVNTFILRSYSTPTLRYATQDIIQKTWQIMVSMCVLLVSYDLESEWKKRCLLWESVTGLPLSSLTSPEVLEIWIGAP